MFKNELSLPLWGWGAGHADSYEKKTILWDRDRKRTLSNEKENSQRNEFEFCGT